MRKLSLKLEALEVESFEMQEQMEEKGTVQGHYGANHTQQENCTLLRSCNGTCDATCYWYDTCWASCDTAC